MIMLAQRRPEHPPFDYRKKNTEKPVFQPSTKTKKERKIVYA